MNDEYGHYDHVVVTAQAGPGAAAEACRLRVPTYTTIGELKAILAEARRSDGFPMYAAGQVRYQCGRALPPPSESCGSASSQCEPHD